MEAWAKLIEAIAGLVGAVAWPVAIVVAVWLIMRRHRAAFGRLIDRVKSVSYPGGQIDLEAIESEQAAQVEVLVEQVADPQASPQQIEQGARQLAKDAENLGRVRQAMVDRDGAMAAAALLKALEGLDSGYMRLGNLLTVKHRGRTTTRLLSAAESAFLDRHQEVFADPPSLLALLAMGEFTIEPIEGGERAAD